MATVPIPSVRLIAPVVHNVAAHNLENYVALVARTVEVFGDEIKASRWLSLQNDDFAGRTPLDFASDSGYDPRCLESVLVRIEHGIYF